MAEFKDILRKFKYFYTFKFSKIQLKLFMLTLSFQQYFKLQLYLKLFPANVQRNCTHNRDWKTNQIVFLPRNTIINVASGVFIVTFHHFS